MNFCQHQVPTSEFRLANSASSCRRGVTLLFVISMIVLFLLMGTTFVVVSNDYLRAAKRRNATGGVNAGAVTREDGQQLVMQSFLEAVRGPSLDNTNNPLRGHDLLGDMYGYGMEARVNPDPDPDFAPNVHASGHFLTFSIRLNNAGTPPLTATSLLSGNQLESLMTHNDSITTAPTIVPGHFNGRLVTITTGSVKGLTCRVIQSRGENPTGILGEEVHTFVVQPLNPTSGLADIVANLLGELSVGGNTGTVQVVINGRPFAGTGAGQFDATVSADMAALQAKAEMPDRRSDESREELLGGTRAAGLTPATDDNGYLTMWVRNPVTGAGEEQPNDRATNEPWDAFDFQNMALARVYDADNNGTLNDNDTEIEPSFGGMRDGAVEYTGFKAFSTGQPARQVDNDNDGVNDGIWIDTGLPVRSTPDGEYIKPLVSYLILDMDGRLNINAHGFAGEAASSVSTTALLEGGVGTFVPGLGLGPAEISLQALLPNTQADLIEARYTSPQDSTDDLPGDEGTLDRKSLYRFAGYPNDPAFPDAVTGGHFFSELDINGNFALGFMNNGTPLDAFFPSLVPAGAIDDPITQTLIDSPYETDLAGAGSVHDGLFEPNQLERMLRPNDRDSILLSEELTDLLVADLPASDADDFLRKSLTTASFEVPAIPQDLNRRLFEVLEAPVLDANGGTPLTPGQIDAIAGTMAQLLSPEVRRGEPMNLNRIFGDGVDNDSTAWPANGSIDEPGETENRVAGVDAATDVELDVDNNGRPDDANGENFAGRRARQNFARRLFTLMVLVTEYDDRNRNGTRLFSGAATLDPGDFFDFDGANGVDTADVWAHRRMLAQWSINVVDFRDADSVMTGMEFDLDPFDVGGWQVDGDLSNGDSQGAGTFPGGAGPNYFVAWGTERPEILITETSALHDVRLQNTSSDSSGAEVGDGSPNMDDDDLDSAFLPIASAFFELTNPWVVRDQVRNDTAPTEFYDAGSNGVDLKRTDDENNDAPVWRLVVFDPDTANVTVRTTPADLTAEDNRNSSSFEEDIDTAIDTNSSAIVRYIYFVEPTLTGPQFDGQKVYYPSNQGSPGNAILEPGQFAVIGSAGKRVAASEFTTYFGRTTGEASRGPTTSGPGTLSLNSMQKIVIDPNAGSTGQVTWHADGSSGTPVGDIAIAIDRNKVDGTRSLGISDPVDNRYFDLATAAVAAAGGTLQDVDDGVGFVDGANADFAIDEPLDRQVVGAADWPNHPLNSRGLIPGYRVVLLQRLADPWSAYDPDTNPYRTVDSSAVDLFVFNGLMTKDDEDTARSFASATEVTHQDTSLPDALGTFERGESRGTTEILLWRTSVMGELDAMQENATSVAPVVDSNFVNTLGFRNNYDTTNASPNTTYPWLTWNNRPFANQFELANVPYASAGWLTRLFSIPATVTGSVDGFSAIDHTGAGLDGGTAAEAMPFAGLLAAEQDKLKAVVHPNVFGFSHLLNFAADGDDSDRLATVMDFVEVPSRFAGSFDYVDWERFTDTESSTWPTEDTLDYSLTAPFDELPTGRYAGKVNVNTIPTSFIWNSLLGSRAGGTPGPYASTTDGVDFTSLMTALDDSPLRPASAVNYTSGTPAGVANTGLFRSITNGRPEGTAENSLFDYVPSTQQSFNNTDRNAYFRNLIRQRLGSIATNRSSVFAIWVTVGYFEWDNENNVLRNMASGGTEYGEETGTVQRSRGFFIFDRSIPMAYEPGEDHNIDRGILLQSLIE